MPFNNDGLLVTSKLCTYYSAVGSTNFVLKLHVAFIIWRNGPYLGGHHAFIFKLNFKHIYNLL